MSTILDEHRTYLADEPRVAAFRRAITAVVRPGDVVLDLGAGTGILGLLAAEAGAGTVYSVERSALINLTREIVAANRWSDRFVFVRESSTAMELPLRADVVIADQIGAFGFEAGMFEYFADARERLLKLDGVTIPATVHLWAAPVEHEELRAGVDFWGRPVHGFDMGPARQIAVNTAYSVRLDAGDLLAAPVKLLSADPGDRVLGAWQMASSMTCTRAGDMHGIGGWFSADLAAGVTMSSSPLDPSRIDRRNVFLPIDHPVAVEPGDRVDMTVQLNPYEKVMAWELRVRSVVDDNLKACFSHSTWAGMMLGMEELQRTKPSFVPHLTTRGRARRTVLELLDGETSLDDVQAALLRRHPEAFRSRREAEVFVAEAVTRYAT